MVSLVGSFFSGTCTMYFWLVRANRERPNLKPHYVKHEFVLGRTREDQRHFGVTLEVVVANYSVLPNAVLGVRV